MCRLCPQPVCIGQSTDKHQYRPNRKHRVNYWSGRNPCTQHNVKIKHTGLSQLFIAVWITMFCHLVSNILLGATMQSAPKNTRNNSLTNLVNFLMKLTLIPPILSLNVLS